MGVKKQRGRKWWGGEEQVEVGCSGFSQKKGIDYDETFAPVACLEAIGILLAFFVAKGFKLYQMDVKSAILKGFLEESTQFMFPGGVLHQGKKNWEICICSGGACIHAFGSSFSPEF
jgi:hypothetical protein